MVRLSAAALAFVALWAPPSAAHAQVSDEILKATAGNWLLAPEDGSPGCRVQLRTTETIGGYELRPSPSCLAVRTVMATVVAWRFDEATSGIAFTGPERETVISFKENEDGSYSSSGEPGEVLLLLAAPPGVTAVPNAKNIFGTWTVLQGGGAAVCRVTFADTPPPGGEESYALTLADGCAPKLANLKLASWRIEGMNLMLYGTDGESFTFQPSDKGTFVADDAKPPLMLVRQDRR